MKLTKKSIYICLFAILYLIVAFSSLYHAVEFFGLANNSWMAVILAFAFEIGQAAVLFALLTSNKDRGKIMPWVLMTMFTLVQVLGNVYSSYKHIINNSTDNLRYFKEPIFIWTQLPDDQATVIITYLVGGLLPISALLLTSMVTNYLNDTDVQPITKIDTTEDETKKDNNENKEDINEKVDDDIVLPEEEIIGEEVGDTIEEEPENTPEVEEIKDDIKDEVPDEVTNEMSEESHITENIEDEIPHDENGKIMGTDSDGGVIGEPGEPGNPEEIKKSKMINSPISDADVIKEYENRLKEEQNEVVEEPVKETPKSHFINLS